MGLCCGKNSKRHESEEGQSQNSPKDDTRVAKKKKDKARIKALEKALVDRDLKIQALEEENKAPRERLKVGNGGELVTKPAVKVADERRLEHLDTQNENKARRENTHPIIRSDSLESQSAKQSNLLQDGGDLAAEPLDKAVDKTLLECLVAHNEYRAKHENTKPMKWSASLASEAQKRAEKIKSDGMPQFQVSGENIGACSSSETRPGRNVTEQWYNEMQSFDFNNKRFSPDTGRFTQVVWKASTEMGAGKVVLHNGMQLLVVRYSPGGNITGKFNKNVGNLLDGTSPKNELSQDSDSESDTKSDSESESDSDTDSDSDGFAADIPDHLTNFQRDILKYHNKYRAKHADTPTMVWSDSLAKKAQRWAEKISVKGKMAHCLLSKRKAQGENICAGKEMTGKKATRLWYAEIKDFNFNKKRFSDTTACFSQVVWKESIEIGAGLALSEQRVDVCVVRYRAAGNASSSFAQNIGDRLATPQKKADMDNLRIKMEEQNAADAGPESDGELPDVRGLASTSATAEGDIQLPLDSIVRRSVEQDSSLGSLDRDHKVDFGTTNRAFQLEESPKKNRLPSSLSSIDDGDEDGDGGNDVSYSLMAPVMENVPSSSSFDDDAFDDKQIYAQVNKSSAGGIANLGLEADSAGNLHVETTPGLDLQMETTPDADVNLSTYDGPDGGDFLGELETVADYPTEPVGTFKPPDTYTQEEGIANLRHDIIDAHNKKRELHKDTPPIEWDEHLAEEAQKWADKIAEDGEMSHCTGSDREGQGENLAMCKGKVMTGRLATENWYKEIKDFDFNNKIFHSKTGHFTQVVWKGSTKIGAAISQAENGQIFCVGRYSPAGNMGGGFEENIGDLL